MHADDYGVLVEFDDDAVDALQVAGAGVVVIRTRSPTASIASVFCELIVCSSSWRARTASAIATRWASSSPAATWSSSNCSGSGVLGGGEGAPCVGRLAGAAALASAGPFAHPRGRIADEPD